MPRVDKGKNWYSGKIIPTFLYFIAGHTHTIILHNKRTCKKFITNLTLWIFIATRHLKPYVGF